MGLESGYLLTIADHKIFQLVDVDASFDRLDSKRAIGKPGGGTYTPLDRVQPLDYHPLAGFGIFQMRTNRSTVANKAKSHDD